MKYFIKYKNQYGSVLIFNVIVLFVFSLVMVSALAYASSQLRVLRSSIVRESAFQIAEAGINYYQWHLARFPNDYSDGQSGVCNPCGPYVHNYTDLDTGKVIGQYSLVITPPLVGSTVTTIQSTGYTIENPNHKRIITAKFGIPSLAKYSFLSNGDAWIGSSEVVSGAFHVNGGMRFDGVGDAPITSAKSTYTCTPYGHGCTSTTTKPGIWGSAATSTRAFWSFPAPNFDFSSITSDLASMKSLAQSGGYYLPPSSAQGYSIVFKNTGKIDIYKVNNLRAHGPGYDVNSVAHNEYLDYRLTAGARTLVSGYSNVDIPSNGMIYIEDRVWVEGTVRGRAMVVAAKLPYMAATAPSIIIPNNIVYSAKDGSDVLGLLGQKDVLLSYYVPNSLEINAGIIAQNGSFQRFNFLGSLRGNLTLYGSIASFGASATAWMSGDVVVNGYQTSVTTYDANLLYNPPPSYPLTNESYQQLNWVSN